MYIFITCSTSDKSCEEKNGPAQGKTCPVIIPEKSPISVLTELCTRERVKMPIYSSYSIVNPNCPVQLHTVSVSAFGDQADATALSKREAKKRACAKLLEILSEKYVIFNCNFFIILLLSLTESKKKQSRIYSKFGLSSNLITLGSYQLIFVLNNLV